MKRESRAFHIEDTYDSGRKNASSRVSGNHIRTSTPLLMVKMVPFVYQGLIGLVKHGKCLTDSLRGG